MADEQAPLEKETPAKTAPAAGASRRRRYAMAYASQGADVDSNPMVDPDAGADYWSVPWADLMMTMFVVFAILISVRGLLDNPEAQTEFLDERQPKEVPQRYEVEREKLRPVETPPSHFDDSPPVRLNVFELSQEAMRETNLQEVEIVLLEDQSVKVSVQGPMLFDLGQAELKNDMREFLDRLAGIIRSTPYIVHVVGHTDDHPINTDAFPSNWELSLVRASRVARYLLDAGGDIDPARFVVMGRGQYAPTVPNSDEGARALNRRVEIIITRSTSTTEPGAML